jgi:hypothetical protein
MSTKNIVVSAVAVACVAVSAVRLSAQNVQLPFTLSLDGAGPAFRVPVEARVVKGAPFSADIVTESIQTLSDGNRIVQRSTTRFYRDSEGRVRREEDRSSGRPAISITDPVAGVSYSLDPENRTALQMRNVLMFHTGGAQPTDGVAAAAEKLKVFEAAQQLEIRRRVEELTNGLGGRGSIQPEQPKRIKIDNLPTRDIEGVRAEGVRRTTTIAAGAIGNDLPIVIVSEEWTSPDLKILVLTERTDPRLGTATYRVTNINRSDPDRFLFEVPADYTIKETGILRKSDPRK